MCTLAEDDSCWAGRASAEIQSLGLSLDSCPGLDAGDSTFSLKEWGTSPLPCPPPRWPSSKEMGDQAPSWPSLPGSLSLFFFLRFIYLFDREIGRGRQREREGEAGSPLTREPDAGLDARTLGPGPEAQPTEPPKCPNFQRLLTQTK